MGSSRCCSVFFSVLEKLQKAFKTVLGWVGALSPTFGSEWGLHSLQPGLGRLSTLNTIENGTWTFCVKLYRKTWLLSLILACVLWHKLFVLKGESSALESGKINRHLLVTYWQKLLSLHAYVHIILNLNLFVFCRYSGECSLGGRETSPQLIQCSLGCLCFETILEHLSLFHTISCKAACGSCTHSSLPRGIASYKIMYLTA